MYKVSLEWMKELVGKEDLLKKIDDRLKQVAYVDSIKKRDDLWQEEFNCLQQLKSQLIGDTHVERMMMLRDHLKLLSNTMMNQMAHEQELTSFYDIKLIVNGVEYDLPMGVNEYSILIKYVDNELTK